MDALGTYRNSRALVLGASGFIGRWVATALCDLGASVTVGVRAPASRVIDLAPGLRADNVEAVDLALPDEASELVATVRPDIVFNLAGYGVDPTERDQALSRRINTHLVREIVETIEPRQGWLGQCFVHVGSALEFGGVGGDLSDPWNCLPTTLYGRTKYDGSAYLRDISDARAIRAVTARLFTIYGPGEHSERLLPTLLDGAGGSHTILLSAGRQCRDFTYVGDAVEGILRVGLVKSSISARALNIATGVLHTVREFVERSARVLGITSERLDFGAIPTRPEEMTHDAVSTAELRSIASWSPITSIEDGVRRTLELTGPEDGAK